MKDNNTQTQRDMHMGGPRRGDGRHGHLHAHGSPTRPERGLQLHGYDRDRRHAHEPDQPDATPPARIEARRGGRRGEWDREHSHGLRPVVPEGGHSGGRGRWHPGRGEGRERLERGLLRYVILDVLHTGAQHGYEIIKQIEEQTQGRYMPSPGTLYPTLQYLEDLDFVTAIQDEGRKVYSITPGGSAELAQHAEEVSGFWSRFAEARGTDSTQYEVSFLRDALDDLSRTVWSSLRVVLAGDDPATIRAVRLAVEQCQNEIRDLVAHAVTSRNAATPRPPEEQ